MSRVVLGDVAIEHKESCKVNRGMYPTVGLEHMRSEEIALTKWDNGGDSSFTKMFRKGNVLFGRRRAYLKKAVIAPFDGICSGDIIVIEAIPNRILPELLPLVIQNDALFDYAVSKSAGSLSPRVKWEHLKEYEFELPDLDKQRKLAEVLLAINDAVESYKKLLDATDELVKARFVEMFGDPISNPYGWEKVHLSELADIKIGPFGSLLHKDDYVEGGHPLVNPSHIKDGKIVTNNKLTISDKKYKEMTAYHLQIGDVVMGRRGEMGRCAVVDQGGLLCGTGSILIRSKGEITADYIQKIISFPSFKKVIEDMAVGQTMSNLNVPIVSNFDIIMPPIKVQYKYYSFVHQTDKSKSELEQALSELTATYKRILSENLG